jgi:outer membrane biosynthesis protein TonB
MRFGVVASVALHVGLVLTGLAAAPVMMSQPRDMVILPVELLEISDTTNVAPVVVADPEAEISEEPESPAEDAPQPSATPSEAPEAEAEILPDAAKKPEVKPEPKKETPKPKVEPKAEAEEDFGGALSSILKTAEKKRETAPTGSKSAADMRNIDEGAPRKGAGDNQRMTITVADFIRDQLQRKGCWGDQEDMADARRLRATFRIRFNKDGTFLEEPQMVAPVREPSGDQPMQIFVQRARRALSMCSPYTVPKEYFQTMPAQWIHIEFLP